jgi:hypothetical protein
MFNHESAIRSNGAAHARARLRAAQSLRSMHSAQSPFVAGRPECIDIVAPRDHRRTRPWAA